MKIENLPVLSTVLEKKLRSEFIIQLNKELVTDIFSESDLDDQSIFIKTEDFIVNNANAIAQILYRVDISEYQIKLPLNPEAISKLILERIAQKILYRNIFSRNKD